MEFKLCSFTFLIFLTHLSCLNSNGEEPEQIHISFGGDIGYDLYRNSGKIGDEFMRMIQPVAARVPYMTSVGRREYNGNFSHYRCRFTMPHANENFFYSFDIGPVHLIALSTEFYYTLYYGFAQVMNQFNWLEKDLQEANKPENRAKRPWIITYGHRPMYCSTNNKDDCTSENAWTRAGVPFFGLPGLEDLFYRYGVDLQMWAHEHNYERTYPIFNNTVFNSSTEDPYVQPRAPIHIISGLAGCKEPRDRFQENPKAWSAFRASNFSYTSLTIHNSTHLHLQQLPHIQTAEVIDDIWIVQDEHGPFNERCWD